MLVESALIIYKNITPVYDTAGYAQEGWGTEKSINLNFSKMV